MSRLLLAVAKRQPLMLLFDNLHLADQSSLSLLEYFARQLTGSAALVIGAYRSGERAADSAFAKDPRNAEWDCRLRANRACRTDAG